MSKKTTALIDGLNQLLKNRGSMTVKEVDLLNEVIRYLYEHEKLNGDARLKNGATIVEMLLRFLLNPTISEGLSQLASEFINKLL